MPCDFSRCFYKIIVDHRSFEFYVVVIVGVAHFAQHWGYVP